MATTMAVKCFSLLLLLLLLLWEAGAGVRAFSDGATLLRNGNFEEEPLASNMRGPVIVGRSSLPGWRIKGRVEYIAAGTRQGDMLLVVPHSGHAVRLGNGGAAAQRLALRQGFFYALTFSAARTCAQAERLNITVDDRASGDVSIQTVYSADGWDTYAWAFRAPPPPVHVSISNPGSDDHPACGPLLDGIAINQLAPPLAVRGSLVLNGGFEAGPRVFHAGHSGVLIPPVPEDATSALPGWRVEAGRPVKYVGARHFAVPRGGRAVELLGGREGVVSQFVRTVPGRRYRLGLAVGDAGNRCEGAMRVEISAARNVSSVSYASRGLGGYVLASMELTALEPITRVAFSSAFYHTAADHTGSLCGPLIDDVSLYGL